MAKAACLGAALAAAVLAASARAADAGLGGGAASETAPRGPFSAGAYAGALYKSEFISIFYRPQDIDLGGSYLAAANFDYRFYEAAALPLRFEAEVDVAKRFTGANQSELDVAPFVRWTSFPWNDALYTNVRFGALGVSYVSGISAWERQNSGNNTGSRVLHFLVPEVTFAASARAPAEFFVRVHHRSGGYGMIDGVYGGSNYLCAGFRVFL